MSRLIVITNPKSKKNLKDPRLTEDLVAILGDLGRIECPDGFEAINTLAVKLFRERPEVVAINGGDGTVGVVMTALHKAWDDSPFPQILLLRGGTMNTVAKNLKLRGRPRDLLAQAVARIQSGEGLRTKTRWMLVVNGRLGFWFGNGVISNFMTPYYTGATPSPFKGFYILIRAALSALVGGAYAKTIAAPAHFEIEVDGVRWPYHEWLALCIGSLIDIGFGFRAFYRLKEEEGVAHALGFACTPFRMAMTLHRIYFGWPLRRADMMDVAGRDIVLRGPGKISYMVDGDLLEADGEVRIGVSRPVHLVVPRNA